MSATNPVSPKVVAASAGAGLGALLSGFIIWLVGAGLFGGGWDAASASDAIAAVPAPVSALLVGAVAVFGAGVPGYKANDPMRRVPTETTAPTSTAEDPDFEAPDWDGDVSTSNTKES